LEAGWPFQGQARAIDGKGTDIVLRKNRSYVLAGCISALLMFNTSALAQSDSVGTLGLSTGSGFSSWSAGAYGQTDWNEDGYHFTGSDFSSDWSASWSMTSSMSSSSGGQSLILNFTVTNTSAMEQTFFLFSTDPLNSPIIGSSLVGGSIAGTYTDLNGDGVEVSAPASGSIYTAFVDASTYDPFDGVVVDTLLDGATGSAGNFLSGNFEGSSFGDFPTIPGQMGPEALVNYGMLLEFTVSAGDTVGLTSSMAIATPAPGALALLGLAAISGRSRRRGG
jgi:hypothetical protein